MKIRALVLFSGGLDSILAARVLKEKGIMVKGIHFTCPFYSSEQARKNAGKLGIQLMEVPVESSYFRMVSNPKHGYGSQANPCIDCKAYMLRRAERLRKKLGFDFMATGEVVGERPMSQNRRALAKIEMEAGLEGRVVRPLSGRILPSTRAEKKGLIKREWMLAISGRSRKPQMALARKFGIRDYPAPAGGCLLTDPEYARRLRGHLRMKGSVTWNEGELLRYGRHFRFGKERIVVGRNRQDNEAILELARKMRLEMLEVVGHPGPLTVIVPEGRPVKGAVEAAAGLTVRYSDWKSRKPVEVEIRKGRKRRTITASSLHRKDIEKMRA
jgi:tRNA-specific 2-thiouridylase